MHGDSYGDSSEFIHQDVGSLFLNIFAHTIYTFWGGAYVLLEGPSFIIYISDLLLWLVSITCYLIFPLFALILPSPCPIEVPRTGTLILLTLKSLYLHFYWCGRLLL